MKTWPVFAVLAAASTAFASAQAAEPGALAVELNKLEAQGDACRAYLLLENGTESAFESLKLDLVMFDPDGVVAKRLAVETAPLPPQKTRLKVFDIDGLGCQAVGRVLLNDVMECADGSGARENCLGLISARGRGPIEFIK